jgi:hypothetical protein
MFTCIMYYIIESLIISSFLYFRLYKRGFFKANSPQSDRLIFWSGLFVFTYIVNMVYTGLMGWNLKPGSELESQLDTACSIIQLVAIFMFFMHYAGAKIRKEQDKEKT